ncbi:MAG: hypothetical protein GWN21_02375 [Gammaproteobacteria bacterium]|nr:hypothetical protein [Gammaproteobacteria bacterium]NIP87876.1 hypothetical protein [Gammaproteobacteria bacterium]NIR22430.1 hypothetical protein [Gammaproteobacteria bacterium]NIS04002.1 hypothetical protein [Gammaproteobacteria bacterium]NIV45944.1 hypothetical protein [Gammaproteobacteria bacterium]
MFTVRNGDPENLKDRIGFTGFAAPSKARVQLEDAEDIASIAVAVFPFSRTASSAISNDADHLLPEYAHQFISDNRQLRLLATYTEDQASKKMGGKADYWSATSQPVVSRIYSDGAKIDADAVLMYSYSAAYTLEDRFDLTVYLFDVKNQATYQSVGNQNNYKQVTEAVFQKLLAALEGSKKETLAVSSATVASASGAKQSESRTGSSAAKDEAFVLMAEKLEALKILYIGGILSEAEYMQKRQILMDEQLSTEIAALKVERDRARRPSETGKATDSQLQALTSIELRVLLTGNTFTGHSDSTDSDYHVYYKSDGTMYGLIFSGPWKGKRDDGRWSITDEKGYCRQWSQWREAQQECFKFYRDGEKLVYKPYSSYQALKSAGGSGVIRLGNPENL